MLFCPECDNLLNISRTNLKSDDLIQDITSTAEKQKLFDKILNNSDLANINTKKINIQELIQSDDFKKLSQKNKSTIKTYLETIDSYNEDIMSYYVCYNCLYSKPIEKRKCVYGDDSHTDVSQYYSYKDYKYSSLYPRTKQYVCPNNACLVHKDPKIGEALFFKEKEDTSALTFICTLCNEVWKL